MTVVVSSWLGQRTLQIQGRQFVKGISTHPCRCVCTIRICLASLSIADVVQKMVNNTVGNWKFQSKGKKIIHQRGLKPALGKSWASVASLRMMLEYNFESSAHTITLLKSNRMVSDYMKIWSWILTSSLVCRWSGNHWEGFEHLQPNGIAESTSLMDTTLILNSQILSVSITGFFWIASTTYIIQGSLLCQFCCTILMWSLFE